MDIKKKLAFFLAEYELQILYLLRHVLNKKDLILGDLQQFQDDIASIE